MTTLRWGSATDVGLVRSINEDQLLIASPIFAVADGMGGHAAGEVASLTAIESLKAAFEKDPTGAGLLAAALQANRSVWERAQTDPELRGMGTTLVALALVHDDAEERLAIVHVGDSRVYLLRQGELEQLTTDHSLVQELVDDGQLSEAEADIHPHRHVLTRALGVEPEVPVDCIEVLPVKGDRYVLCSDGLPRELSDSQLASVLRRLADPGQAAKALVAEARARGGNDNITVVIVDVVDDDDQAKVASEALASDPGLVIARDPEKGEDDAQEGRGDRIRRLRRTGRSDPKTRAINVRVIGFLALVLILLGLAVGAIAWYARGSYFVGVANAELIIYKGRPGGLLWFQPTVAERTNVPTSGVLASRLGDLHDGKEEPTLAQARSYVHNLQTEAQAHQVGLDPILLDPIVLDPVVLEPAVLDPVVLEPAVSYPVVVRQAARRRTELGLIVLALLLTAGLYVLASLGKAGSLPANIGPFLGIVCGLLLVAHLGMRRWAPFADPVLLPTACLLNGIGYVFIVRLNRHLAGLQATWTAIGIAAFLITLVAVRRARDLERYRYTFAFLGIGLLLMPLAPVVGQNINGARLWVRLGTITFQPGELAKIALAIFFASYMVERSELLSRGTLRIGRFLVLDPKYLAPVLVAWALSLLIFLFENDLGSSFLFFALFIGMLWVATGRAYYLSLGAGLFALGSVFALKVIGHAKSRIQTWRNPWPFYNTTGYQIIQSWFGFAAGGIYGAGPGLGSPQRIPDVATDFIFAAIAEELGLLGATAVVAAFLLMVGTGLRIAIRCERPFEKLLATGLSLILGVQTFVIIGGVTRLIPLTGITLPFVSYGGSSLIANYILLALLLRISNDTSAPPAGSPTVASDTVLAAAR